jgi:hypothetical protein
MLASGSRRRDDPTRRSPNEKEAPMPSSTAGIVARTRLGHTAARAPHPRDMDWRPEREPSGAATAAASVAPAAPEPEPRETWPRWVFARLRFGRA